MKLSVQNKLAVFRLYIIDQKFLEDSFLIHHANQHKKDDVKSFLNLFHHIVNEIF